MMKGKLEGQSSPLDTTLETVLPGLHERFDAQRKATEDLHGLVSGLESRLTEAILKTQDATMYRLESEFHLMFRRIRGTPNVGAHDDSAPSPSNATRETALNASPVELNTLPLMPITYSSLSALYNHWTGEGEYENMYAGGISKLESEKGSKWRKSWDNAANKRLSKVKAFVSAIKDEGTEKNLSVAEVLQCGMISIVGNAKERFQTFMTGQSGAGRCD